MKKNEFIPLSIPDLRGREAEYLARCVEDNWISSAGPFVSELELRMSNLCKVEHGVAVTSGTAALHLALLVVGVGPGDHVIIPDWTFAATANAVLHCGAVPVFVDIEPQTWGIDPIHVEACLMDDTLNVRAIIGVDTLGHPANWDRLRDVCVHYRIPTIEDAAGSIGASYKGRPTGSLADIATFSFNGNKLISAGGGGMIVTNNADWATNARHRSTQARIGDEYIHDTVGFNYRLTNINAALAIAQLERLDEMVAARRNIAQRYDEIFSSISKIELMPRHVDAESSCWLYSIALPSEQQASNLLAHLHDQRIGARRFWRSLSVQAPYQHAPRRQAPVSKNVSGRVISLPCSSSLTEEKQNRVIDQVLKWTS